jgi:hypothetical protein
LTPDHILYQYWGRDGFFRPELELLLRGRGNRQRVEMPRLDMGSPYILFDEWIAPALGLTLPFARRITAQAVDGSEIEIGFPEDGEVSLFLSDYRTGFYLWQPLVGFLVPRPDSRRGKPKKATSLLGFTGFFQHFDVTFPDGPHGPEIEVTAKRTFPGRQGSWPLPPNFWAQVEKTQ